MSALIFRLLSSSSLSNVSFTIPSPSAPFSSYPSGPLTPPYESWGATHYEFPSDTSSLSDQTPYIYPWAASPPRSAFPSSIVQPSSCSVPGARVRYRELPRRNRRCAGVRVVCTFGGGRGARGFSCSSNGRVSRICGCMGRREGRKVGAVGGRLEGTVLPEETTG